MDARIKELLKPEVLNTVNGLELIARTIVEGFMSGSNKSQSVGSGQEFSQYKNYQAGDDLRQLDWKMFARSERYYIKQAEIETNITVKFIVDASHSMAYSENGLSKLHYAKVMTAALAYLARKQSDTFGLFTVNDQKVNAVQPRFEQQQFIRFLNELVHLKSEGRWNNSGTNQLLDHSGKEMIVFITDMYDDADDLHHFISQLKNPRNEVIVFHLMGQHETDFDFEGSFTFEDLESGVKTKANTVLQQKEYSQKVKSWLQASRSWMLEKQINYQLTFINEPVEIVLRDFLTARKKTNEVTLANPIFLWALTGLSIPVIIHLLSRKEGKIIRLGSIRHVVETSTQQFKGIRLNEILLLMLRSALIVIFSLLLSGLQCTGSRNQKWVVIEKDLRDTPLVKVAADSLSNSGFEIHLLARSFPDLQSDDSTFTSYGEIVESLKAKKLSEVVVFASNRMQRFNGPQVELPENIRWISVPFETKEYQLSAVDRGDSVILRTGFTGADETYFVNKRVAHNINASTPDTVKVLLVNDEAFSYDQKMVGAALKAIGMSFPVKLIVDMSTPSVVTNKKYDWCFWLSQKSMPSNISVNTVLLNPQASNEFLVQKKKHEWVFTKRLNEETSLSEELTLQLSKLIVPDEKLQAIARNYDRRSLPDSLVWSSVKSNYKEASVLSTPADRFLIICLLALLLAERIIAYQRKQ